MHCILKKKTKKNVISSHCIHLHHCITKQTNAVFD